MVQLFYGFYYGFSGGTSGGIPEVLFYAPTQRKIIHYSTKIQRKMNNVNNMNEKELSYYGLYLLRYLIGNHFPEADNADFIEARANQASDTYEQARLEGYPADGAQELAMSVLLKGLHHSKYALLMEVILNEFSDEIPEAEAPAFAEKLLPLIEGVFSIYDLSDDSFAISSEYDALYTELTGAVVLYLEGHGV